MVPPHGVGDVQIRKQFFVGDGEPVGQVVGQDHVCWSRWWLWQAVHRALITGWTSRRKLNTSVPQGGGSGRLGSRAKACAATAGGPCCAVRDSRCTPLLARLQAYDAPHPLDLAPVGVQHLEVDVAVGRHDEMGRSIGLDGHFAEHAFDRVRRCARGADHSALRSRVRGMSSSTRNQAAVPRGTPVNPS
jgi:hypothetical protein